MTHKQIVKMISKMATQITTFYLEKNAKNFNIKIDKNDYDNEYYIHSYGFLNISDSNLSKLKKSMEIHHDVEYDQYWELMGEGDSFDELLLVARISEEVKISYNNNNLEMILIKKF